MKHGRLIIAALVGAMLITSLADAIIKVDTER